MCRAHATSFEYPMPSFIQLTRRKVLLNSTCAFVFNAWNDAYNCKLRGCMGSPIANLT